MDFRLLLENIKDSPDYKGQIVYLHEVPARIPHYKEPSHPIHERIKDYLNEQGIGPFYSHQADAYDSIMQGNNTLIGTGTASGKSLCYVLPILESLLEDKDNTSLLLYPTKALTQDQSQGFRTAISGVGLNKLSGVFDGDTTTQLRRKLRDHGSVILTNPDMLHSALMSQHVRWERLLSQLRYLVIDEMHVYNGIFGSNMANVLRRFYRICNHYGSKPQIIAASATIGNPKDLAERLTGEAFTLIDNDGSPCGKRSYLFWDPPQVTTDPWRSRRSANVEAHEVMSRLIKNGARTITFSKSKTTAEMIHRYVHEDLTQTSPHLSGKISPYRGGYIPSERREIEQKLFNGELLGISTTRALELGIDIGGMDACVIAGYPGTLSSFYQQAGRAGRRQDESLVVLVALDTPANQYIMSHPDYLFGRPIEDVVIDVDNAFIVTEHLRCAAHELPLPDKEVELFGPNARMALEVLEGNRKVRLINGCWYHASTEIPQHEVSLRNYSVSNVSIEDADTGQVIGQVDRFHSRPLLHPDAIYLHQGDTYQVLSLDLQRNLARVTKVDVDYYTQPLGGTDVHHIDYILRDKEFGTGHAYWGEVTAHFNIYGFEKIRFYELDAISKHDLNNRLPLSRLETMAVWIVPPEQLMVDVQCAGLDVMSGLRGIGYATRMILPLYLTCDTLSFSHTVGSVNSKWNAIFIYERYPHGLGFTENAYDRLHEILPSVLSTLEQCLCEDGCMRCVGKPLRGELTWNPERGEGAIPSKKSSLMILRGLIGDGSRLKELDSKVLSEDEGYLRMTELLRRRLERMREPEIDHIIAPEAETTMPEIETDESLAVTDQERRSTRRREFSRILRQRIAENNQPKPLPRQFPPSGTKIHGGANAPTDFKIDEEQIKSANTEGEKPKVLGDSLASKARRLKKGNS